jgi:hypothetical protein
MTLGMKQIMVEVPDHISDEYAQDELNRAFSNGVNWDTINCYVDMWREHQEGES